IFADMRSILALDAFAGNAGTDYLRQSIVVDGVEIECIFNLRPHGIGPWLSAAHRNLERAPTGIEALRVKFVEDREHVAWRDEDDIGHEIHDQANLSLGHAAGN